MSVQATSWVWDHSKAEGNARLVLLAIADGANKEGRGSCQSIPTIAGMCRISERTVHRKIKELVEAGELLREGNDGRYGTISYALPIWVRNDDANPCQNDTCQNVTPDKSGANPCHPVHEPLTTMSANPIYPNNPKGLYPSRDAPSARTNSGRGSRIPEDFQPDQKHVDRIRALKPNLDIKLEHTKFMNYWLSATGNKATKKDWGRTWENWMLNAREENVYRPGWQKRFEFNKQINQQFQDPDDFFRRSIEQ